jgi:hypothetical protein
MMWGVWYEVDGEMLVLREERLQLGQRRYGEGVIARDGEGGQGKRVLSTSSGGESGYLSSGISSFL